MLCVFVYVIFCVKFVSLLASLVLCCWLGPRQVILITFCPNGLDACVKMEYVNHSCEHEYSQGVEYGRPPAEEATFQIGVIDWELERHEVPREQ